MERIHILLLGVSFRVYISYKIRTRQKSEKNWKSGNGRNAWSPQRGHFFSKIVSDHANPQMYQSHKTLRLRREMSLPPTFIRPFQDNPQSCPLNYQRVIDAQKQSNIAGSVSEPRPRSASQSLGWGWMRFLNIMNPRWHSSVDET